MVGFHTRTGRLSYVCVTESRTRGHRKAEMNETVVDGCSGFPMEVGRKADFGRKGIVADSC